MRSAFAGAALSLFIGCAIAAAEPFGGAGPHFFVARGIHDASLASASICAGPLGPVLAPVFAIRGEELHSFQPNVTNGEVESGLSSTAVGKLTVCYLHLSNTQSEAVAVVELVDGGAQLTLRAEGSCENVPAPMDPAKLLQTCSLSVVAAPTDRVRGGLITSNGLTFPGDWASSANNHVWTLFFIRDPG